MAAKKSSFDLMKARGKAPITCWPTIEEKKIIARAAKLDGRSMAMFMVRSALEAAKMPPAKP